jgi:Protein of unknown function with HXXEE motif
MNAPARHPTPAILVWGVPAAVLLHNVEEALTFARYAPSVVALVPEAVRARMPDIDYAYIALVVATAIPIALAAVARRQTPGRWAMYGLLLVAAVVLVNVVWHVAAALALGGYAPGVVTAVAINLPVMTIALRRARREGWLSRGAVAMYLGIGVLLHGTGLLAVLALVTFSR